MYSWGKKKKNLSEGGSRGRIAQHTKGHTQGKYRPPGAHRAKTFSSPAKGRSITRMQAFTAAVEHSIWNSSAQQAYKKTDTGGTPLQRRKQNSHCLHMACGYTREIPHTPRIIYWTQEVNIARQQDTQSILSNGEQHCCKHK